MEITLQTKIASLLEAYPALEETLLELSPVFAKLKNPVLRRTIAKVANVQQAAQIAGIPPGEMVQTLRKAAGLTCTGITGEEFTSEEEDSETPPEWFDETKITVRFDGTPLIDSGQHPIQEVTRLAEGLGKDEIMEFTVPFKPVPLIDLLKSKGFSVWHSEGKNYFIKL